MSRPARLGDDELEAWVATHAPWRVEDGHLVRELTTTDYASGVEIAAAQVALAERLDHHPVITLGYRTARFEIWTHDRGGLTDLDLAYAQGLDELLASRFSNDVV